MQHTLLVSLLMDFVTTAFKGMLITDPIVVWHSTKNVITCFGYLLLVSLVNIFGQLLTSFNVYGIGSLDCTIANEGVIHQISIKVNAVDEYVKVRNTRLRIKV